jgi:hypothetical protein
MKICQRRSEGIDQDSASTDQFNMGQMWSIHSQRCHQRPRDQNRPEGEDSAVNRGNRIVSFELSLTTCPDPFRSLCDDRIVLV